jgi:hypothetical protein
MPARIGHGWLMQLINWEIKLELFMSGAAVVRRGGHMAGKTGR